MSTVPIAVSLSKDYLQKTISREGTWISRNISLGLRGREEMHKDLYSGASNPQHVHGNEKQSEGWTAPE